MYGVKTNYHTAKSIVITKPLMADLMSFLSTFTPNLGEKHAKQSTWGYVDFH